MIFKALLYTSLIDPLLAGLRHEVAAVIKPFASVIDIACGPGTTALEISKKALQVTGIDLDSEMIKYASVRTKRKGIGNLSFQVHDASDLSLFRAKEFDYAVTTMAVHQFHEETAVNILKAMKRISTTVIIADYNCPLPTGLPGSLARGIEYMARGDHYRNFTNYMNRGGVPWFAGAAGLHILSSVKKGSGVLVVAVCK